MVIRVVARFSIMIEIILILAFLAAIQTGVAEEAQVPLASSLRSDSDSDSFQSDTYKFEWPIHKIAIIGAGPGYVLLQSESISTIHFDLQWAHCLSGVLSGRL